MSTWTPITCALLCFTLMAEAQNPPPPARTNYLGRTIAQTMHWTGAEWLLRQEREREESSLEMVEQLQLKPGQTVCDLGSGNGYHTLMMAEKVGASGRVFAVDIQQEMLDLLNERANAAGLTNVTTILGAYHDPRLPEKTVDLVLLVDTYHEFSHPAHMLQAIRRSLSADGVIALVEFRAEDKEVPIKRLHKMSKEQIFKEFSTNGFTLVRSYDDLPWQHLLFFKSVH